MTVSDASPPSIGLDTGERAVVWFGAGVSIPSGLPGAASFVQRWLSHLLPESESRFLTSFFTDNQALLGRVTPRMEKVIEDAVWSFGEDCLALLDFFSEVDPNEDHRRIGAYLRSTQGWAVTTNFDRAVETSAPDVPVHTPSRVGREEWGLIKLHGSIDEPRPALGHSIRNLVRGVAPALRRRLVDLLCDPRNVHVFVGYSGTDFFDVIPFFRDMSDPPRGSRAIWIDHHKRSRARIDVDQMPSGPRTMLGAFKHGMTITGDTSDALLDILCTGGPGIGNLRCLVWDGHFRRLFEPVEAQKWLYAAKLYSSLGMGSRSMLACRAALRAGLSRVPDFDDLVANALRDGGHYDAEVAFRESLQPEPIDSALGVRRARHAAAALRLSRRPLQAIRAYDRLMQRARAVTAGGRNPDAAWAGQPLDEEMAHEVAWALAEAGLFYRDFLIRLPQRGLMFHMATRVLSPSISRRIWECIHRSENLFPKTAMDPHLAATLARLRHVVATAGAGGVPLGTYVDILRGELPAPEARTPLGGQDAEAVYSETDSILGRVNALRERARTFERLSDRGVATTPGAAHTLLRLSLDAAALSFRLASLIDDVPGSAKSAEHCARLSARLSEPSAAYWRATKDHQQRLAVRRAKDLGAIPDELASSPQKGDERA